MGAYLPKCVSPEQLLKAIFHFVQTDSNQRVREATGLTDRSIRMINRVIREIMREDVEQTAANEPKLGGEGRIVAIDETYFTKCKRSRS